MLRFCLKSLPILAAASLPSARAACDRDALLETVDEWMMGQEMGLAGPLQNIAANFTYVQNNRVADITGGQLFRIMPVDHNRTLVDMAACATYTELIMLTDSEDGNGSVVGVQIRHDPSDNSVFLIDAITTGPGDWVFNAMRTLHYAEVETDWGTLEPSQRSSRGYLKAVADNYLDMWTNLTAVDAVPWGQPCNRLEGGEYTGQGNANDTCKTSIPTGVGPADTNRRYVIDEEVGSVDVLSTFGVMDNAPDSHEFRVVNGKLRYIHAMTVTNLTAPSGLFPAIP